MSTTQPEARITKAIRDWLQAQGAFVVKVHGGAFGHAGVPDLLACLAGRFIGLEVKQPGKKPTLIQAATLQRIRDAGGLAAVVTSIDDVRPLVAEVYRSISAPVSE